MRHRFLCLALLAVGCASEPTLEPMADPDPSHEPTPVVVETETETETVSLPAPKGLQFTAPEEWVSEPPKNDMRKAQFVLPRAEGDPADAELVVFHFGGGGGGVDANVDRWAGQFTQEDGSSTRDLTVLEEREINGMQTTLVEMGGRYVAETAPGSGERVDREDYAMLAAIVDSGHGNYFVKLVGPRATIEKWREAFDAYVNSAR